MAAYPPRPPSDWWFAAIEALSPVMQRVPPEIWQCHILPLILGDKRHHLNFRATCRLFRGLAGEPRWYGGLTLTRVENLQEDWIAILFSWHGKLVLTWHYLILVDDVVPAEQKTLRGHTGSVLALAEWNGLLASASRDTTIRVWDEDGECIHVLRGHTDHVLCLAVFGDRLASGSDDSTIRFWDFAAGECMAVLPCHTWVTALVEFSGYLISATFATLTFWNARAELVRVVGLSRTISCLTTWNGLLVAGNSCGNSISLIGTAGERAGMLVEGSHGVITSLAVLDGRLVSISQAERLDGSSTLRIWDTSRAHTHFKIPPRARLAVVDSSTLAISGPERILHYKKRLLPRELLFPL